jgi:hypothetical protein
MLFEAEICNNETTVFIGARTSVKTYPLGDGPPQFQSLSELGEIRPSNLAVK